MSKDVIIAYKKLGETPLECLKRERVLNNINKSIPMTYVGRLDPMAEGLIILLVGEECKNKEKYLGLDKTYEFEILVGFETDTYDLLGVVDVERSEKISSQVLGSPHDYMRPDHSENLFSDLSQVLNLFIGTFTQKYPRFSSKTVGGKQLFQISKDGELPSELPEHEVTISKLSCTSTTLTTKENLQKELERRVELVHGDFRQEEIIKRWDEVLVRSNKKEFAIFSCTCECTSGTYIRQLVHDVGEKLGIPMTTYSIKRVRVGSYSL